mgnify:CR=1 FL=1
MIRWEEVQENRNEQSTIKCNTTKRAENVTKWKTKVIKNNRNEIKYRTDKRLLHTLKLNTTKRAENIWTKWKTRVIDKKKYSKWNMI